MFVNKKPLFILCLVLGLCQAGFVDTLQKCSIKDSECLTNLYQKVLIASGNGIPEIKMSPTDPFPLKDESVTVLDLITITMIDGEAKGVKNCVIKKVKADLEVKNFTMDFVCDFVIKGKYKVTSNPAVKNLIGGEVYGDGHAKVETEKLHIRAGFEFFIRKGEDGELYFDYDHDGMKFVFTFGKFRASADKVYIGDQEMSEPILQILNNNWRFFLTTFGKPFVQKGMDFFFKYTHMFYDNVPAKNYINEDMTPYLSE